MTGALLCAAFVTAAVAWLRASCERRFRSYDPARDQHYDITGSDVEVFDVAVDRRGFRWPDTASSWDTAHLSLSVESTVLGRIADPRIDATVGNLLTRQYLERGAGGLRLLNVSGLRGPNALQTGDQIALSGSYVTWPAQIARLHLCSTALPPRPRILVLASHPDDAEIAAFGLYARSEAFVVTITAGDHAGFYLDRARRVAEVGTNAAQHARVWDSITVPFFGGVPPERCVNLGYRDSTLADMFENGTSGVSHGARGIAEHRQVNLSPLTPAAPQAPSWAALVEDLVHLMRAIQPDVIVMPHPLLDDHPDHAFTSLAACEALEAVHLGHGQLLLYVNHSPRSSLYPFGQNDGAIPPPPHFGEPIPFRTIFSEPLSTEVRELKFLALEAMHDLRTLPADDPPSWTRLVRTAFSELRGKISGRGRTPTSYFRRAVRPNELFFAMPFSDAPLLREHFRTASKAGRVRWHVCP